MIRKTLTILSLVGLLLSVGLWGVSCADVNYVLPSLRHMLGLKHGSVRVWWLRVPECDNFRAEAYDLHQQMFPQPPPGSLCHSSVTSDGVPLTTPLIFFSPGGASRGFCCIRMDWWPRYSLGATMNEVHIPLCWSTAIFGAIGVYTYLPLHRRRKREKLGLCVKCGYDLRASKDRCPECGARFEKPKRSADCRA